jgi:bifunctional non-homologous end joining protein LigD
MLEKYNKKRNFAETPEPMGKHGTKSEKDFMRRFVVQKHQASRLHYDFRLETEDGILKSWAVPKGISVNPRVKRLAVLTEDHPIDYLLFEGTIPEGNYGAGTVLVWDTGSYVLEKSNEKFSEQFDKGKITFIIYGHKVKGRFSLIRTARENQWLLIKYDDEFAAEEELTLTKPDSVLTQKTNVDSPDERSPSIKTTNDNKRLQVVSTDLDNTILNDANLKLTDLPKSEFPNNIRPMLATLVDKPFNNKDWDFEIKWDGVRSILFYNKSKKIVELRSRSNRSIGHRYPEIIKSVESPMSLGCKKSVVLDGEIVILDEKGHPDFQSHQRRMNVDNELDIQNLSKEIPSTFYIFDILYLDGRSLEKLEFSKRRDLLAKVVHPSQDNENVIRISESFEERGVDLFENIKTLNLEGIIAKNKQSRYSQGARTTDWLKIKNIQTQDCVIIGYTRGEGNRKGYFGSLLLAAYRDTELRFIGHTGSGFDFRLIAEIYDRLQEIKSDKIPVKYIPYTNRDPVWVRPALVAEVKFDVWTKDKIMRAPIFLRIRDDKKPQECILERMKTLEKILSDNSQVTATPTSSPVSSSVSSSSQFYPPIAPTGKGNNFTNLDKIFWPKNDHHSEITKGDLIDYYGRVSDYLLPFLKDRPLSLSRYPDGITGKSFYQKNWNMERPEFVDSVKVYSESTRTLTNYLICNNKDTLLWLVNLGCIEIHPWYSRVVDYGEPSKGSTALDENKYGLSHPDFIVFDLDPYIYSDTRTTSVHEPKYNIKAFKTAVEIAQLLKTEIFDKLKIKSYIKTSGMTGLHIFVPVLANYTYDQTRSFAAAIGRMLVSIEPHRVTMDWNTSRRRGKIFFDYNQNAEGKTLASVFSARPSPLATISMPIEWSMIDQILPTDFTILNVPDKIFGKKDVRKSLICWSDILENRQDLNKLLEGVRK